MNVLHVSSPTSWRGGERQVFYTLKGLEKRVSNQYLLCPKIAPLYNICKGYPFKVIGIPSFNLLSLSLIRFFTKVCIDNKIELIHVHDSKAQSLAVLAALLFKNRPKIIVTRRVVFPVKGYLSKFKYNYKKIEKIICISEAVKTQMDTTVPKNNKVVIPSAIDIQKFNQTKGLVFPIHKEKFAIAYVAALTREKDHSTFINTAFEVLKTTKNVHFYIVGSGKEEQLINDLIAEKDLQNDITMLGFVREIDELIPQLDLLLFTSKSEGLGSTILDFFLAKKPVVATKCGGNEGFMINGVNGLLSEIGDVSSLSKQTIELINNSKLRAHLVQNAYELVTKRFSIEAMAQQTFDLYLETVNQ